MGSSATGTSHVRTETAHLAPARPLRRPDAGSAKEMACQSEDHGCRIPSTARSIDRRSSRAAWSPFEAASDMNDGARQSGATRNARDLAMRTKPESRGTKATPSNGLHGWPSHLSDYASGKVGLRETAVRCNVGEIDLICILLRMGMPVDEAVARRAVRRCRTQIDEVEALLVECTEPGAPSNGRFGSASFARVSAG